MIEIFYFLQSYFHNCVLVCSYREMCKEVGVSSFRMISGCLSQLQDFMRI